MFTAGAGCSSELPAVRGALIVAEALVPGEGGVRRGDSGTTAGVTSRFSVKCILSRSPGNCACKENLHLWRVLLQHAGTCNCVR